MVTRSAIHLRPTRDGHPQLVGGLTRDIAPISARRQIETAALLVVAAILASWLLWSVAGMFVSGCPECSGFATDGGR